MFNGFQNCVTIADHSGFIVWVLVRCLLQRCTFALEFTVLVRQSSGSSGTLVVVVLQWYTSGTQSAPRRRVSIWVQCAPRPRRTRCLLPREFRNWDVILFYICCIMPGDEYQKYPENAKHTIQLLWMEHGWTLWSQDTERGGEHKSGSKAKISILQKKQLRCWYSPSCQGVLFASFS